MLSVITILKGTCSSWQTEMFSLELEELLPPISCHMFMGSKIAASHIAGIITFVNLDQRWCFSGRITAKKRSVCIQTRLKIQPRRATKTR